MIVEDGYRAENIIKNISRIDPSRKFEAGETLLFFDELQEFPEIAAALKFFCMDGRYDVICSGSMLGIQYRRIESNSVGYKTDYKMYSMDFEEFLWAKGYDDAFVKELLEYMLEDRPLGELMMSVCRDMFLDYCILGGMPAVVRDSRIIGAVLNGSVTRGFHAGGGFFCAHRRRSDSCGGQGDEGNCQIAAHVDSKR